MYTEADLIKTRKEYCDNYDEIHTFVETMKRKMFDNIFINGTPAFRKLNKALRASPKYLKLIKEERRLDKLCITIRKYLAKPEEEEEE